jgi:hypothetical protein
MSATAIPASVEVVLERGRHTADINGGDSMVLIRDGFLSTFMRNTDDAVVQFVFPQSRKQRHRVGLHRRPFYDITVKDLLKTGCIYGPTWDKDDLPA